MPPVDAIGPRHRWPPTSPATAPSVLASRRNPRRRGVGAGARIGTIAAARRVQIERADDAEDLVDAQYASALHGIDAATQDGALLRGEVLARWQDFVGTSDVFLGTSSRGSPGRATRSTAWFKGVPQPVVDVETTIEHGLHAVIVDQAGRAAAATWRELQHSQPGRAITDGRAELATESAG